MPPKTITIFEGPDGSGKTTVAREYAKLIGAVYVHLGPLPRVSKNLARMYVEAMMPALMGYQHLVMDRCWLSELPYGVAFREGKDRLGDASRRMLERIALRCGAVVVRCDPGLDAVLKNYNSRRGQEMLTDDSQLMQVYSGYYNIVTDLPEIMYNYTTMNLPQLVRSLDTLRYHLHPTHSFGAGRIDADIAIIGDCFGPQKNCDPLVQFPFVSFSNQGCSQWLTNQLTEVSEFDLLWVNADAIKRDIAYWTGILTTKKHIFALGDAAHQLCLNLEFDHLPFAHPQHWMRFRSTERYPFITLLETSL